VIRHRGAVLSILFATVAFGIVPSGVARAQVMPDMVSRTALRVCSDPSNLPFSNRKREGFENKIADIVASELGKPVRYFWAPSGPGFVRNTLNSDLCDIVIGYTIGSDLVQSTNPYYRSTYAIVALKGSPLNGVDSLDEPKLKGFRLGVFAATPPVDVLLAKGLLDHAKVYPLIVDHRFDSPLNTMIDDLKGRTIDAAIVWGPLISASVKASGGALVMTPLLKDAGKPDFSYRISFGIRRDEPDWKHKLEGVIRKRRADIDKVLADYNVPLLDNVGHLISSGVDPAQIEPASTGGSGGKSSSHLPPPGFQMPGPAPITGK
jgi:quinoprotein dehydrogenase-associated probable ABC transporter substrate-binding protein